MTESNDVETLRTRVHELMPQARSDLAEMVAFKSVYDPAGEPPPDCDEMVEWLITAFTEVGVHDVEAHVTADGSKAVTGHIPGPPGAPRAARGPGPCRRRARG